MSILFTFSGAGLLAPSGLATFRAQNALWEKYDVDVVCNYDTWRANYSIVHDFYDARRKEMKDIKPNAGHYFFAELEETYSKNHDVIHLTTNIDDLLERSGCKNVVHLHGNGTEIVCQICGHVENVGYRPATRYCENCNSGLVKPNVVFFNETAPNYKYYFNVLDSLKQGDIAVVVGASSQVVPIDYDLADKSCYKISVNPDTPIVSSYDKHFSTSITECIDSLRKTINNNFTKI